LKNLNQRKQIELKKAKNKKAKRLQTKVDDKIKYEVNEEDFFVKVNLRRGLIHYLYIYIIVIALYLFIQEIFNACDL